MKLIGCLLCFDRTGKSYTIEFGDEATIKFELHSFVQQKYSEAK